MKTNAAKVIVRRVWKIIDKRAGNVKLMGLRVNDVEILCRLVEYHALVDEPKRADNMVECDVCEGEGYVEATCSGCAVLLTKKNVAQPFGYEGSDVCKRCQKLDDDYTRRNT